METPFDVAICDEAHYLLQWGHAFVSVETRYGAVGAVLRCTASMGPRFCKRGNIRASADSLEFAELQWGHAFVSVETAPGRSAAEAAGHASMGPRFCKRGNTARVQAGGD